MKNVISLPLPHTWKENGEIVWRDAEEISDTSLDFEMGWLLQEAASRNLKLSLMTRECALG